MKKIRLTEQLEDGRYIPRMNLKNSRAGYMVCGISCNHAVVPEVERLLQKIEDKEI